MKPKSNRGGGKYILKNKAFTLIELLAVIVILSIIALIAVPIVLNIIDNTKKSAFKESISIVSKAGQLYYTEVLLKNNEGIEEKIFEFPDSVEGLKIDQKKTLKGIMKVRKDGSTTFALNDGVYCAKKGYNDKNIDYNKDIENCIIPVEIAELEVEENITVGEGSSVTIEPTIFPSAATNKKLKWTSLDTNIATVENGVITGVSPGSTTITVETMDGSNISKTINVTVTKLVSSITLSSKSVSMYSKETQTITATVKPDDAGNKTLKWTSQNTSIATVTQTGIITGVKPGSTTVTVETTDGSNIKETINVTINSIMTSSNSCVNSSTRCANGTEVTVKVNPSTSYTFYTINDTGTKLTLIISRNLGSNVVWINESDYTKAGGTDWSTKKTEKGPRTALYALEERTSGWTNIPTISYTLSGQGYSGVVRQKVRARLLTKGEATSLGCSNSNYNCPIYLANNNIKENYLLSTAYNSKEYWYITYSAPSQIDRHVKYGTIYDAGIRPVIEIPKNL